MGSSQADYSATFEKLKNASAFLLSAAGMLAYIFTIYSTTKIVLQDSGVIRELILSEFLPSRIKGTIPYTSHYSELLKNKEYIKRASIEAEILGLISRKKARRSYYVIYANARE